VVLFVWDYDKLSMKTACRQKILLARIFSSKEFSVGTLFSCSKMSFRTKKIDCHPDNQSSVNLKI